LRQLGTLSLRAGILVLDGAHTPPFTPAGEPLAGGLALVEPDPNILVAFNAAPGTIGPNEPGPYGAYAQALAHQGGVDRHEEVFAAHLQGLTGEIDHRDRVWSGRDECGRKIS
jgi:hypothetical protein